jgi:hypothetical protein
MQLPSINKHFASKIRHDPNFKPLEFEGFRKQAGLNSLVMTPKNGCKLLS